MTPFDSTETAVQATFLTLADILGRNDADLAQPPWRRRDRRSALLTLERLLGRGLSSISAEINAIMALVGTVDPNHHGLSRKRWANLLSELRALCRNYGLARGDEWVKGPPSSAWLAVLDGLGKHDGDVLRPFARYCTSIGIAPAQVTDEVTQRYRQALMARGYTDRRARTTHQTLCRRWNALPQRPTPPLSQPLYREFFCPSNNVYPASFWADMGAYCHRLKGSELLDFDAPDKPLRDESIAGFRYRLTYFAAVLGKVGVPPTELRQLADLVTDDRFARGAQFLHERAGRKPNQHAWLIMTAVRRMAKHYAKCSSDRLEVMERICSRLAPTRSGMTEKNQRRVAEATLEQNLDALLLYPVDTMARLARQDDGSYRMAVHFAIALAIELLIHTLLRIKNLASLHLDEDLIGSSRKSGEITLYLASDRMKNGQTLKIPLPASLAKWVRLFARQFRPRLLTVASGFLFPGRGRPHKRKDSLGRQITKTIKAELGLDVNPHLFRHIGGVLFLTDRPGDYASYSRILAHKSMETVYTTYSGTETERCFQHLDELVRARRARAMPKRRRR